MSRPGERLAALLQEVYPPGWPRSGTDPLAGLDDALRRRSPVVRAAIRRDVDDLLRRGLCEMQLRDLVAFEMECHFDAAAAGTTIAAWLRDIATHATAGRE